MVDGLRLKLSGTPADRESINHGGHTKDRVHVGYFNLTETKDYTRNFECAAWFETVRVQPGRYDVYAYPYLPEHHLGHSLYIECEGVVVDASFQALFGGVPLNTPDRGKDMIGKTAKADAMISTTTMHEHVVSGALELCDRVYSIKYVGGRSRWDEESKSYVREPHTYTFYRIR